MKKSGQNVLILVTVISAAALVFSCSLTTQPEPSEAEIAEAVAYANEMTYEATQRVIESRTTGDASALGEFAAEYGVADILSDEMAVATGALRPREVSEAHQWILENARHGDILVFNSEEGSSWTHNIMELVLVGDFYHAGVYVDPDPAAVGDEYLISASVRIADRALDAGVMMQSIEDVTTDCLRVGRIPTGEEYGGNQIINEMIAYLSSLPPEETMYAFLYPNLDPVPRYDDYLWYCSKVAWRIYDAAGANTEYPGVGTDPSMEFYLEEDRWAAFMDTALFQLYHEFLSRILGRWPVLVEVLTLSKLTDVLTELITPDELWYWGVSVYGPTGVSGWGDNNSYWGGLIWE